MAGTYRRTDGRIAVSLNAPYGGGITIEVMFKGTSLRNFFPKLRTYRKFCHGTSIVERAINLARERWMLRA